MRPLSEQERTEIFQEVQFENAALIELRSDGGVRPGVITEVSFNESAGTITMSWLEDEKIGGEPREAQLSLAMWQVDRFSQVIFFELRQDISAGSRSLGAQISESVFFHDDDDDPYQAPFAYQYNIVPQR